MLAFLILGASPWFWGGVQPPFPSLFGLAAAALLAVLAAHAALGARPAGLPLLANPFHRAAACLGSLFVLFVLFQTLPLPRSWLGALSPGASRLHLGDGPATISLHPEATASALFVVLAASVLFLAPLRLVSRSRHLRASTGFLAALAGVVGAYALFNYLAHNEVSLHFARSEYGGRARGPFVNPNHLATFLALGLPASLSVLFYVRSPSPHHAERVFSERLSDFLVDLSKRYWKILAAVALAFTALPLVFSMSRAGMLAGFAGASVFLASFAALRRRRAGRPAGWMLAGTFLLLLLAGVAVWLGLDPVMERYASTDPRMADRLRVWEAGASLWKTFPVFGTGLGTFRDVFPLEKPAALSARYTFPHNEFVGLVVECGVVGTLLLLGAVATAAAGFLRDLARRNLRTPRQLAACWAFAGLAVVGLHGIFDFSLHMPAVAFLFAFVSGQGLASVRRPLVPASGGRTRRRSDNQEIGREARAGVVPEAAAE